MKIALIGEFSSLHKYLKEGLKELGHEIILLSTGDGYKKIGGFDYSLGKITNSYSIYQRIKYCLSTKGIVSKIRDYDCVQLIHTNVFPLYLNEQLVRRLKVENRMLSLVSAGSDYAFYRAYKTGKYEYHPYNFFPCSNYDGKIKSMWQRKSAKTVENLSDVIIPSLYEYTLGYNTKKLYSVVPFPINVKGIEFNENKPNDRIVFFHGLNREIKKGTTLIRAAMERLKKKYPNDVDIIIDGHMPFDKYTELMKKTNVVIDQTYGYGYGINSCIALAQGKVVVNPCKQEQIDSMGATYNPFISINPDADDIYEKLCWIVENRNKIVDISINGRQFVEQNHDHIMIAQKYMDAWKSVM